MAFTRTPLESTEKNAQIPLLYQWWTRQDSRAIDTQNINVLWEITNGPQGPEIATALKRDGCSASVSLPSPPLKVFYSDALNEVVTAGAFGIKAFNAFTMVEVFSDAAVSFNLSRGNVGATEYQYEDGRVTVIITDGTTIVEYTGTTVNPITSPDLPVPHMPYPVYMNGYLFLATGNQIYNSNLNNPLAWTAGDNIGNEAYPDAVRAIARLGVYIVAFADGSIQFYYDAANPSGTPLAVYTATAIRIGYRGGAQAIGDTLYFVGAEVGAQPSVYRLSTSFKVDNVGSAVITRVLSTLPALANNYGIAGSVLTFNGHRVYVVFSNIDSTAQSIFYDTETSEWGDLRWRGTGNFQVISSTISDSLTGWDCFFCLMGSNTLYKIDPSVATDDNGTFTAQFTTKSYDFGSRRIKFGTRLLLGTDQLSSPTSVEISWSDDDYQTFSIPRPLQLSNQYVQLYRLGKFRRRAWRVRYADVHPMHFTSIELDYSIGQA